MEIEILVGTHKMLHWCIRISYQSKSTLQSNYANIALYIELLYY